MPLIARIRGGAEADDVALESSNDKLSLYQLINQERTNVYNRVAVRLNSHDVGGITNRDFALAKLLDELGTAAE